MKIKRIAKVVGHWIVCGVASESRRCMTVRGLISGELRCS
jgi:hypothetical protein